MLREEIEQYTNLTGEDGWHVPIMKVGAYLDGYNKGLEVLDEIRAEINSPNRGTCDYFIVDRIEEIINKYKTESEE